MSGSDKICGAHIAIGESADGIGALFGRNAGCQAMFDINSHREGCPQWCVIDRHHRVEMQAARVFCCHRRADDPAGITDNKRHFIGRAQRGRANQIAFIFTVVIIGYNDQFTTCDGLDGFCYFIQHGLQPSIANVSVRERMSSGVGVPMECLHQLVKGKGQKDEAPTCPR